MNSGSLIPRFAFLAKGAGFGEHPLAAFDAALREAGVASQNLVPVSSVFPPGCTLVSREEGLNLLAPGQVTFCVMARHESNVPGTRIAAAMGLAVPEDPTAYGYLAEHHAEGQDEEAAAASARAIAAILLGRKLGVSPSSVKLGHQSTVAQTAVVSRDGKWTSVVALCVLVL